MGCYVVIAVLLLAVLALGTRMSRDLPPGRPGRWFAWSELIREGSPPPDAVARLERLVRDVLDPLRSHLERPVIVTSGWRSPARNAAIGGSETSDHPAGNAADIRVEGMSSRELARAFLAARLPFDQVVWYDAPDRHIHIGHRGRAANRGHVLHALPEGGYTREAP